MTHPFLSPRNDVVFKMIFGDAQDTGPLTDFLKSALTLPPEEYAEVTLVDPHLKREDPEDKLGILDVKVRTTSGQIIDIEIQVVEQSGMRERIVFYLSRMVAEQIGQGEGYDAIQRSICILICDHVLIGENKDYHNCYRLYDPKTGSEFTDLLEVNTLELPKLPEKADGTALWDWLKFVDARKEEDLTMLTEKNPQVGRAVGKLMALSEDEQTRMIAESREKLRRDIEANERAARKAGREDGREEGREEAQLDIARNALKKNMSLADIMELTGLSREAIQSLLH
jgi:predicted transposase/invertase (TIGR01784 family)